MGNWNCTTSPTSLAEIAIKLFRDVRSRFYPGFDQNIWQVILLGYLVGPTFSQRLKPRAFYRFPTSSWQNAVLHPSVEGYFILQLKSGLYAVIHPDHALEEHNGVNLNIISETLAYCHIGQSLIKNWRTQRQAIVWPELDARKYSYYNGLFLEIGSLDLANYWLYQAPVSDTEVCQKLIIPGGSYDETGQRRSLQLTDFPPGSSFIYPTDVWVENLIQRYFDVKKLGLRARLFYTSELQVALCVTFLDHTHRLMLFTLKGNLLCQVSVDYPIIYFGSRGQLYQLREDRIYVLEPHI